MTTEAGSKRPREPARSARRKASWSSAPRKVVPGPSASSKPPMRSRAGRRQAMLAPWPMLDPASRSPKDRLMPPVSKEVPSWARPVMGTSGWTAPVTKSTAGQRSKSSAVTCTQSSVGVQSSSVNSTTSLDAARHPALRARQVPGRSQRTTRAPAASATRRTVGSVEAESTTTTPSPGRMACRTACRHRCSMVGRSLVAMTTVTGNGPGAGSASAGMGGDREGMAARRPERVALSAWPRWRRIDPLSADREGPHGAGLPGGACRGLGRRRWVARRDGAGAQGIRRARRSAGHVVRPDDSGR